MSYLALARKYRPRRFEDVMGQGHVVKALAHALDHDRLHPAILLTGTRGVGKTTLARIIGKGLNCETGVSANPCGICGACKELDQGRFVDMIEIDAASNTGVDDVRVLIENAAYAPVRGRYKIYIIDEVHMLSKNAFNALLKTLEEPPPYVRFILATTDPQKLLPTVVSRCLQFNLKRLPQALIREQIAKVLEPEGIAFEPGAVAELARAADGSMRDALSLTDQAIAFAGGGALQREPVEEMLGTSGRRVLYALLTALAAQDATGLNEGFVKLEGQAPDYAALLSALAAACQRIAVLQLLPGAATEDDDAELLTLKDQFSAEDVQLHYQMAVLGRRDLVWAPDPRLGFEMTLLRMLAFKLDLPEPTARPLPAPATAASASVLRAPAATAPVAPRAMSAAAETTSAAPAAKPRFSTAALAVPAEPEPSRVRPVAADASWAVRIEALGLAGLAKQFAMNCVWLGEEDGTLRLTLDVKAKHLLTDEYRSSLQAVLAEQLGRSLTLVVETGIGNLDTPAAQAAAAQIARAKAAEEAMASDPSLLAFQEHFGAVLRPGSLKLL